MDVAERTSFAFRLRGSWDAEHIDNAHPFLDGFDEDDWKTLMEKALMGPTHSETNPVTAEPEGPLRPMVGGDQGAEFEEAARGREQTKQRGREQKMMQDFG